MVDDDDDFARKIKVCSGDGVDSIRRNYGRMNLQTDQTRCYRTDCSCKFFVENSSFGLRLLALEYTSVEFEIHFLKIRAVSYTACTF